MGTRTLTVFIEDGREICNMFKHWDGYPKGGYGEDLAGFLSNMKLVNGISIKEENEKIANGMGCLIAQVIAHFKQGVGDIYIYPPKLRHCDEQYIYTITGNIGKEPKISIKDVYKKSILVEDYASKVLEWIKKQD